MHVEEDLTFSQVGVEIRLDRYTAPYILSYYAPLAAMVLVSFISFFISPKFVPGRVALLITIFLVLTTFFGNIQVFINKYNQTSHIFIV